MKWSLILLFANVLFAGDGPRLFYSKSFPGSVPAYFQVTLDQNGDTEYREAPDEDNPLKFHLAEAESGAVFGLAEKLDYFKHPLESPVKVAFMGAKTFRYENGDRKSEAKFNYTEDPQAKELMEWFERMGESAQHRIELERTAKYDRLGVLKALLLLESAMDRKRLVGTDQYLPMLDRIANNEGYMHTARARAAEIAEAIRHPKPGDGLCCSRRVPVSAWPRGRNRRTWKKRFRKPARARSNTCAPSRSTWSSTRIRPAGRSSSARPQGPPSKPATTSASWCTASACWRASRTTCKFWSRLPARCWRAARRKLGSVP
jgi:hypothetical protein